MRIHSIRIQNFRAFKDATVVVNDYTCLVGPNGAGKSTILCALNVFFRATENSPLDLTSLEEEDFFDKDCSEPIRITVTFKNLSAEAQTDFAAYYRSEQLIITAKAEFDPETGSATVKQYGQRKALKEFAPFFEAQKSGKKVADLSVIFSGLKEKYAGVAAAKTKDAMAAALNDFENSHPELCELIESEDEFYGVSKGADRLGKYVQWVFVPAVKDATTEQTEAKDTALGKILERTVRSKVNFSDRIAAIREQSQQEYRKLLDSNQSALNDISEALQKRLWNWAHPDTTLKLEWRHDPDRAVRIENPFAEIKAGEGKFEGNLARFGHGLQRSYLLALLQELSGSNDASGPRLILAIEEPELYQHPPQARHLAEVLKSLSKINAQVLVCTHSPYFVSGEGFEDVRLIRNDAVGSSGATSSSVTFAEIAQIVAKAKGEVHVPKPSGILVKINQELQPAMNEIFFAPVVVLVEGLEDAAYITTYLHLMEKWDEYRKLGAHIVPVGGKHHLIMPLAIVQTLRIHTFVVFDSDGHETQADNRLKHEKDNKAIQSLCGVNHDPFPDDTLWTPNAVMWPTEIGRVVVGELDATKLPSFQNAARAHCGHIKDLEKNSLYIADWLSGAWAAGVKSPSLERLCNEILVFAKNAKPAKSSPVPRKIEMTIEDK